MGGKVNSELAKSRKALFVIRSEWQNSNASNPFSFTKNLKDDEPMTLQEYAIDYIKKKGVKD